MKRFYQIGLVLLMAYLATGLYQIRPEERAVVRRWGSVVAQPGPGLWISWPYGIDRVDRIATAKVIRLSVGYRPELAEENPPGQFLTGDQNLINVQLAVDYSVGDSPDDLVDYLTARDRLESILQREVEGAVSDWVAGRSVDEVLLAGNTALPLWVQQKVPARLQGQRLGIRLQQTSVAILSPPDEVRFAFEEVNRAQSMARAQENKAYQEANQRKREAEANVFTLDQQAKAYAESRRSIAQAEADAFVQRLTRYLQLRAENPQILHLIWYEEMARVWLNMKNKGRIDLLDAHLGSEGLDITTLMPSRRK